MESFNARLRDELLNGEIFYTMKEAQIVIESWRRPYKGRAPARRSGLPAPGPGGVRDRLARLAGCACPTGSAGQATLNLDHLVGRSVL